MYEKPQLWLQDPSYQIDVQFVFPPYEAGIRYADGTSEAFITSLDENGQRVLTKKYDNLPTVAGDAIFTSDGQLVEITPENLPVEGVSVNGNVWSLSGERTPISFINLDDYILNYENYKTVRQDITEGTPYEVTYSNYNFIDYMLIPTTVVKDSSYEPVSLTTITFG